MRPRRPAQPGAADRASPCLTGLPALRTLVLRGAIALGRLAVLHPLLPRLEL
ncbi:hypothetical protein N8J89_28090 [Crossiella sp. CA-258035]|uniref:hypothetical protein n=1 Tax=Crossiella sp. CA-258035 TaxID=2981138 RepID=UPI0024BCCFD7|nr:hypothetical protein [Crossiella sp. CA-258035]WHT16978.1 hypothetical protein N8J89_28090 [Crossiella sp. CA-258035]